MCRVAFGVTVLSVAVLGCSGPGAQLASCQQDKDQLLATIRQQRDANRQLQDKLASLEGRLDQSEKELARRVTPGTRISSRPAVDSKLPWRGGSELGSRRSEVGDRKSGSLAALALVYYTRGDLAKAVDLQKQAYFNANPKHKPGYSRTLKSYQEAAQRAATATTKPS